MPEVKKVGNIIILSSPSGAGKTTLVKKISKNKNFFTSISHTTRAPRLNEKHGKDYIFINKRVKGFTTKSPDHTIDQCKKILIMKNMLLAYKLHKKASSSSKKPKNVSSSSSKKPNNKKDKSTNELVELAEKYVEANKNTVKRGDKKSKKKGKRR